ncbi:hypothetical protein GGX14DRAFT_400175 [Mycena pura]|uniref:Uncharacterized protein n=1 Tax=Mycena pura TaxID=153505 RepID=A0AAD6V3C4_9AGAR|nr:hypothetical protein GGX14DRAFT_400175 [Mycena pura]
MSRATGSAPAPGSGCTWYGVALLQAFEPFNRYNTPSLLWHVDTIEGEERKELLCWGCIYNGGNRSFEDGLYWIEATPVQLHEKLGLEGFDCAFEIQSLRFVGEVDCGVDARFAPRVQLSGMPSDVDEKQYTFSLLGEQYSTLYNKMEGLPAKGKFHVECVMADSARWKDSKPIPRAGRCFSATGVVSGVYFKQGKMVFRVIVDNVIFLGGGAALGSGKLPMTPTPSKLPTGGRGKLPLTFANLTPGNPNKRRRGDDGDPSSPSPAAASLSQPQSES